MAPIPLSYTEIDGYLQFCQRWGSGIPVADPMLFAETIIRIDELVFESDKEKE